MASVQHERKQRRFRITYAIYLPSGTRYRSRYSRQRAEADSLRRQLEAVETATRTGLAAVDQIIEEWIGRGWLKSTEARETFRAYRETSVLSASHPVDLDRLLAAYEEYALETSKAGSPFRKSHRNHLSLAGQVVAWLREDHPDLNLTAQHVEGWLTELKQRYSEWSVHHYLTKLRLLLDQAVTLGMASTNVARQVSLPQPRRRTVRRILTAEEARHLLEASLKPEYRRLISGCLPTVVRLGLYAGLRDEEMAQCHWIWLDEGRRILTVQANRSSAGEDWLPKDAEMRQLDVKQELVDYLTQERHRQEEEGILGPYLIVAGSWRRTQYRGRPIGVEAIQHAFGVLIRGEGMDERLTPYSMRHTYCTSLLRAGVDVRTVQARMGHSDLRTTMGYLHSLEAEAHPTDVLPY